MPATCSKCGEEVYWIKTGGLKEDGKPKYKPPMNDAEGTDPHECSGSSSSSGSRAGKVSSGQYQKDMSEIKDKLDLILRVVRLLLEPDPEKAEEVKSRLKTVEGEMPW